MLTCKQEKASADNPFFSEFDTPYGVPPFELIKNEHYLPAFKEGVKLNEAEIEAITNNTEEANFENTILALDKSGEFLGVVSRVFYNINSANTNDEVQDLAREVGPMLSQHSDNIALNQELFKRVKTVYDNRDNAKTDGRARVNVC